LFSQLARPVKNEEILQAVKEENNILHAIKWRKANWIGHVLRRNCLLKHVFEGNIEGTGRWRRRHKQILDDIKEKIEYCNLKEETLDRTVWRISFGRGYGPVVRQTMQKNFAFNPHCGPG
jgi:hypothetical protein